MVPTRLHRARCRWPALNTPDNIVKWIVMPQSILPGGAMPNLGVTDRQARNMAAYLYTLQ